MARPLRASLAAAVPLALAVAVLAAVNLLPPDTAVEEIDAAGRLTVCAPPDLQPLVARGPARPGFEIALVDEAARRSGWRVSVTTNAAMTREFNPANWRISRATCRLIVGGLRDNDRSRSLMEMGAPYLRSGWVWLAPPGETWPPATVAFTPGSVAMDRVGLGTYLRGEGVRVVPLQSAAALPRVLKEGTASIVITDALTAGFLLDGTGLAATPLPGGPAPEGLAFGFWKGDTTLRRRMDDVLAQMVADGTVDRIANDYGVADYLVR
ncbi:MULTISPECIES: substrate-binding periplasmic protein [unclassified Haematobacter]|uniref:substrate-binding periplasmic protein n=1 Tax=unclassified Haematobacter TaxID=2640585 RepID=UPI0025BB3157|nr:MULTISPECIES: transporter substrate-binding domain-containing protein [unclassified Haematobacter]